MKMPSAVSFSCLACLSRRLPATVNLILILAVPAARKISLPDATSSGLAFVFWRASRRVVLVPVDDGGSGLRRVERGTIRPLSAAGNLCCCPGARHLPSYERRDRAAVRWLRTPRLPRRSGGWVAS